MADKQIKFKEFCDVCEKIQECNKFADKEKIILNFINKFKELEKSLATNNTETTFYSVLRLLIPEYERDRPPYGLKETSFSKLYVRTLCLQGSDASNLLKYNKIGSNSKNTNDFADIAYWVLRKWCPKTSTLSIADVNYHLDQMAKKHADHQPREVEKELSKMIKTSTAIEQKWIIRIILKNMRLGVGNDRILKIYHPDAADLYDVSSSLSKVCVTLKDKNTRLHELDIEIFSPFRPMLSFQCDAEVLNQVIKNDKIFYVENKFDGERFQLHMKNGIFKYFSKNGYEYSNVYGENYNSPGLITPHLKKIFSNIDSVIFDGEMMGWNTKTNNFGSKGMNFDVKTLKSDNVHRPCFCIFDVLLLNGTILTNKPLSARVRILDDLFEPIKGVIQKSSRLEIKTKEDLLLELNKSVDRQEEGICFKDSDSIYKPNNRKAGWWKLKLEYFDGLMTELDVIILGGYYGEGKRKGLISSFLLGVAENPPNAGESPTEFHTFAKVASGFSAEELENLLNKLNQYWEPFEKNKNPEGIVWKKEKPDCWINPRKSCILQIKASELCRSSYFQTDYTLRFPRVEKIRFDKPWYNCLTISELKELTKSNKAVEKLSGRHLTEGDVEASPTKKRKSKDNLSLYHLTNVEQKSTLLAGKEFCVFTGNEEFTKENIEVKIKECGGKVVQFTGPNTMCTLIGDVTPRAKSLIAACTSDIVKLDWIIRILNSSSKLIKLTPHDMIITSTKTKLSFSNQYDKYGDSYEHLLKEKELKNILKNIVEDNYLNLMPTEFMEFDNEISFQNDLGLFRSCFIYFDQFEIVSDPISDRTNLLSQNKLDFLFYGGTKCDNIETFTTHVVMHSSDHSRIKFIRNKIKEIGNEVVKIVNEHWINACIISKDIVLQDKFYIN